MGLRLWGGWLRVAQACAILVLVGSSTAGGHQRHVGGSLLALLVPADGLAVVRTLEATQGPPVAHTRMALHQPLAGVAPRGKFALQSAPSPARYQADQTAIVMFERDGNQWRGVQLLGEELVIDGARLDAPTARWLSSLWKATHGADPESEDLGALLHKGLRLPHPKLRKLAALDIEELSHHKPGLSAATQKALRADLEKQDLDPEVRFALSRALRID